MSLKLKFKENKLTITRGSFQTMALFVSIGTLSLFFGFIFVFAINPKHGMFAFKAFGIFFSVVGIFTLFQFNKLRKIINLYNGFPILYLDKNSFYLTPITTTKINSLDIKSILRIDFVDRLKIKTLDGTTRLKNQILFHFHSNLLPQDIISLSKLHITKGNNNSFYAYIPLPPSTDKFQVKSYLESILDSQVEYKMIEELEV